MSLVISSECRRLGLRAGAILFLDLRIGPSPEELHAAIRAEVTAIREQFDSPAAVKAAPEIAAFQEILRSVGVNPRRDQNSVERLLTLAVKRGDLPAINALVDAYNLVSVRTRCSLGAHDLDRIALPVSLERLAARREFVPLGASAPVAVAAGEYAYVDGNGSVLCRLDVVQADFSKVTPETRNALLIVESSASHPPERVAEAFEEAARLVTRFCGGVAQVVALPDAPVT